MYWAIGNGKRRSGPQRAKNTRRRSSTLNSGSVAGIRSPTRCRLSRTLDGGEVCSTPWSRRIGGLGGCTRSNGSHNRCGGCSAETLDPIVLFTARRLAVKIPDWQLFCRTDHLTDGRLVDLVIVSRFGSFISVIDVEKQWGHRPRWTRAPDSGTARLKNAAPDIIGPKAVSVPVARRSRSMLRSFGGFSANWKLKSVWRTAPRSSSGW